MNVQVIEQDGRPEWAVIPYTDYLQLMERLEQADEVRAYDQAKAELVAGEDETIPAALVDRLGAGESPLRVWRDHRGLSQQALADLAGVSKSYVCQLEAGTRSGAIGTLRALAGALRVDVDDLSPWPME